MYPVCLAGDSKAMRERLPDENIDGRCGNEGARVMKLHGYFRSSSAYRCRIALNLKGVAYDFSPVHLKSGEQKSEAYRALNPQMLVPTLELDGGARLIQSLAIIEWLNETHPQPPLLSEDPLVRAQERGFAQVIACEIHPLQNLRVLQYLSAEIGADDAAKNAWLQKWIRTGLEACEGLLAQRGQAAAFCFGEKPGLADICLVPQVFSAERFNVEIDDLQRLKEIYERCVSLPEFERAHPKNQPDFEE